MSFLLQTIGYIGSFLTGWFIIDYFTSPPSPNEIIQIVTPFVWKTAFIVSFIMSFCMVMFWEIIKAMFREKPVEQAVVVNVADKKDKKSKTTEAKKLSENSKVVTLPREKVRKN